MINLKDARQVIAAAEVKAHELGQPMNIAVVDAGGNLVPPRPPRRRSISTPPSSIRSSASKARPMAASTNSRCPAAIPSPRTECSSRLPALIRHFGGVKRAPRGNSMGQMGQRVRYG
jgi:uncharacterized protein GlcG (DUF336 family)